MMSNIPDFRVYVSNNMKNKCNDLVCRDLLNMEENSYTISRSIKLSLINQLIFQLGFDHIFDMETVVNEIDSNLITIFVNTNWNTWDKYVDKYKMTPMKRKQSWNNNKLQPVMRMFNTILRNTGMQLYATDRRNKTNYKLTWTHEFVMDDDNNNDEHEEDDDLDGFIVQD